MAKNDQLQMEEPGDELKSLLISQDFGAEEGQALMLEQAKERARSYAELTNGIAVLSDLREDACHIYSGLFGRILGLPEYVSGNSAFEHEVFNHIPEEELLTRHILELRFFHYLKSVALTEKAHYYATCLVHFQQAGRPALPVLHSTRYLQCHANGSVWLGLCTYTPFLQMTEEPECGIVNVRTGQTIQPKTYEQNDCRLLSKRQTEILSLLAQGMGSKQIADQLYISVHTVNRHRQDILSALRVTNAAAAVKIGLRLHLI